MAAADISVTAANREGVTFSPVASDGANGNAFANDGKTVFYISNASGETITVKFVSQVSASSSLPGTAPADDTVAVLDGVKKIIGPYEPPGFSDSAGKVQITYLPTDATPVTVAAIKI
tara:strand:+ start:391 stop:744 length:354 start_codon:yes stop_codon:yes gene_type:complete